jgi:hypothetical protein
MLCAKLMQLKATLCGSAPALGTGGVLLQG